MSHPLIRARKRNRRINFGQIQQELVLTRAPKATDPIAPELDSLAVFARLFPPQQYVTEPIVNGIREAYRQIHPHLDLPVAVKGKHPKPLENILAYYYGYGSGDPDRSIAAFWYHAHGYAPNGGPLPEIHRYPSLEGRGGYMMLAICPDAKDAIMPDLGKCYPLYRTKATEGLSALSGEVLHCGAWAMNEETGMPYCVAFAPACGAATGFPVISPVEIAKFQRRLKDSGKAIDKTKAEISRVKEGPSTRGQAKKLDQLRLTLNAAYDHYQDASWHLRRASGHFEGSQKPEKWIQEIGLKRGEFTKLAADQGMTAQEFIKDVLKHKQKYSPGLVKAARLRQTLTRVGRGEYSGPLAAARKLKKVCIGWREVHSKFYNKKIWKCDEYARPTGEAACLIEPMSAPFSKRTIRSRAKYMADQFNEQYGWRVPEFVKEIRDRGGIRPYKERTRAGKVDEEYMQNVPLFLRRKKGLPPDEMASEMGFDTDSDLYEAISEVYGAGKRKAAPTRKKKWYEFIEDAHYDLLEETLGPR